MAEIPSAERFIYDRLVAGSVASGRIYSGVAPVGAVEPFVVIQLQSAGNDVIVVGGARVWAEPLFVVKAVAKTRSWGTLSSIADAIDAALHNTAGTVTGANIWWCIRERPFSLITDDGEYRHLGGEFRVRIK